MRRRIKKRTTFRRRNHHVTKMNVAKVQKRFNSAVAVRR